jgi:hypothetical protein
MNNVQNALVSAQKIYTYYYNHAIKKYDHRISSELAQRPADYVYNALVSQPECYINSECCLEYCNERLDYEFNTMDPALKRKVYEKAFGVQSGNVSDTVINTKLKSKRRQKIKELYNNLEKENELVDSFKKINLKRSNSGDIEHIFKRINLN